MLLNLSVSLKARFQTSKAIKHLLANLLATSVSLLPQPQRRRPLGHLVAEQRASAGL